MKKATKMLVYVIAFLVVGMLVALYFFGDTAKDISTSEFYKEMGVIIKDELCSRRFRRRNTYGFPKP